MKQEVSHGVENIDGEKVSWTYYLYPKNRQGQLKALYNEKWLIEEDHGFGLEHALNLLRLEVKNIRSNKKDSC
jgi:hypothetical protein